MSLNSCQCSTCEPSYRRPRQPGGGHRDPASGHVSRQQVRIGNPASNTYYVFRTVTDQRGRSSHWNGTWTNASGARRVSGTIQNNMSLDDATFLAKRLAGEDSENRASPHGFYVVIRTPGGTAGMSSREMDEDARARIVERFPVRLAKRRDNPLPRGQLAGTPPSVGTLVERFDNPTFESLPYKQIESWSDATKYRFAYEGEPYDVEFIATEREVPPNGEFLSGFNVSFFRERDSDHLQGQERGKYALTGGGGALPVLGTVVAIMRSFVETYRPAFLRFTADEREPSRVRLYEKMIVRTRLDGYEPVVTPPSAGAVQFYLIQRQGRFDNPSAEEIHGPSRQVSRDDLLERIEPTPKGRRMYWGVDVDTIVKVREFEPGSELIAVITYRNMKGREASRHVYIDSWTQKKAERKFLRADLMMGELPQLRKRVKRDLTSEDARERAAAVVVALIDSTTIRIGGSASEKYSGNVGATTLRVKNIKARRDGSADLKFSGKSHVEWDRHVTDLKLARALVGFAKGKRPGDRLFPVSNDNVNQYLAKISPKVKITAKDFRSMHASVKVHADLSKLPAPATPREAEKNIKAAVSKAAELLGNTPSVCRSTYVNPRVIAAYLGRLP